ncbi:OLC1v1005153C1 [Oldenlandia corymbosa var. corymbosa]|uniref:OLC1v1005153C1 n=1 Tax=Oldenlandia corymbosa var. corymbosa TaxID=529605 RepID=A0AAV1DGE5_OLDCO|nr:OLC1v1005153C1 [Oldenlandia corymbosa var. corymbosa]
MAANHHPSPQNHQNNDETTESRDSWARIVARNCRPASGLKLDFYPQQFSSKEIEIDESEWSSGIQEWQHCLVGFVYGSKPYLSSIQRYVSNNWGNESVVTTRLVDNGKPICTDGITTTQGRLSYARIYVEIDPSTELIDKVTLKGPGGIQFEQKIEYEWVPSKCTNCVCFGHSTEKCNIPLTPKWIPKQSTIQDSDVTTALVSKMSESQPKPPTHHQSVEKQATLSNGQNDHKQKRVDTDALVLEKAAQKLPMINQETQWHDVQNKKTSQTNAQKASTSGSKQPVSSAPTNRLEQTMVLANEKDADEVIGPNPFSPLMEEKQPPPTNKGLRNTRGRPKAKGDHSPGIIEILPISATHPPFRFCNFWTSEEDFLPTVAAAWSLNPHPRDLFDLQKNIKSLKSVLKGTSDSRKASIAWHDVCRPVNCGGLGLRDSLTMNKALLLRLIWDIHLNAESSWVKWIHEYYIKEDSFWNLEVKQSTSWPMKKLFKLRVAALQCVSTNNHKLEWIGVGQPFTVEEAYQTLFQHFPRNQQYILCWGKYIVPKHGFITWLACLDRLKTRKKIAKYDSSIETSCPLCMLEEETTDHLFFERLFSIQIITKALAVVNSCTPSFSWPHFRDNLLQTHGSNSAREITRGVVASAIYSIWEARNHAIFFNHLPSEHEVMMAISFYLKMQL